jgi:hypothetical protein
VDAAELLEHLDAAQPLAGRACQQREQVARGQPRHRAAQLVARSAQTMTDTAAHLVDRILRRAPYRQ